MRAKEFVNEIIETPLSKSVLDFHKKIFFSMVSDIEHCKIKEFSLRKRDTASSITYGLFDIENNPVSYLNIDKKNLNGLDYNSMIQTYTEPNYRQQGWSRALIDFCVKNDGSLLTDNMQSTDAIDVWKSLIKKPGALNIRVYNIATKEKSKLHNPDGTFTIDPWKDDEGIIRLLAEDKNWSKPMLEHMERVGRTFDNWYGYPDKDNP